MRLYLVSLIPSSRAAHSSWQLPLFGHDGQLSRWLASSSSTIIFFSPRRRRESVFISIPSAAGVEQAGMQPRPSTSTMHIRHDPKGFSSG